MAVALQRLRKEFVALQKKPLEGIRAAPLESNILEWHYVIEGAKDSPFEGGFYHGTVVFPKEYPFRPPSIIMMTPNGRFETNTRLCLSMSDFHPESWNPMWSVGTILMGLFSFMLEDQSTQGSVVTSKMTKRDLAVRSLEHNVKNAKFVELFPDLKEVHVARVEAAAAAAAATAGPAGPAVGSAAPSADSEKGSDGLMTVLAILVALLAAGFIVIRQVII
jgi:ubiquitin-conjugating enzyme E2 J2